MATIAFDLNGTLMDPLALAEPLGGGADGEALVLAALDTAVAQAMALTVMGTYRPFAALLEAGLRRELALRGRDPGLATQAVERTSVMAPYPEAGEALGILEEAGHRLAVITNSATASAEAVLEQAGLRDRFVAVVGSDEAGAFKPDPRVYALGLERLGVPAADLWLVAAHWWDILGASHAGLRTAWVARKERSLLPTAEPDVTGDDLRAAARAIVADAAP